MANAGGLAMVLLAALLAVLLAVGAVFGAWYALRKPPSRRAYRIGMASFLVMMLANVLSTPVWTVVLSGKDTHGEPLNYGESMPLVVPVVFEGLVLLLAIAGTIRQRLGRVDS